jgi:hypothetical protein
MAEAASGQKVVTAEDELALPIQLRGVVIGALGARRPVSRLRSIPAEGSGARGQVGGNWSNEEVALAEAIADQLAQTMEGLRLLDETQRRAAEERLIGDVTGRLRQTLSVVAILQTAAQEMRAALDLAEVEVRMGTPMEGK